MKNTRCFTLIGMSGVGKSTAGKLLAQKLDCTYVESDCYIESFIERQGVDPESLTDEEFASFCDRAILELEMPKQLVMDTGGSLIYAKEAMKRLRETSTVVYLSDTVENIKRKFKERGVELRLVGGTGKSFDELCLERMALYEACADVTIDVSAHAGAEEAVNMIMKNAG